MFKLLASLCLALTFALLGGPAWATKMTEQQVKNVCGSSIKTGGVKGATVSGCEKACGKSICTYNCCTGSNCPEKGCNGHVLVLQPNGSRVKADLPAMRR